MPTSGPVLLAATPVILGSVLFPGWLFQGLERMSVTSAFTIGSQALVMPLTFGLVQSADDTWMATLIRACAPGAAGLASLAWLYRQRLVAWQPPRWADTRHALAEGWHIFISTAAISVYTSNQVILGFLCGPLQVGLLRGRGQGAHCCPRRLQCAIQRCVPVRLLAGA